ncbi:phosphotransferase [Streptomyces sp. NPDC058572]|uniref:phosphotransferase n=1 Tax=Streptomyces sp. NPDC058572 TaxID=3346546 RepID=UPI003653CA8E
MHTGELLGSGRTADVFAIDDRWVLRQYRDGGDAAPEAAVMSYLADHGYPVPRLRRPTAHGDTAVARTRLEMQRLTGPSMVTALEQGAITPEAAGAMLADLLRRLHAIPARLSADPADRLLHLDLHPENVMLMPDGPMVIDWSTADEGRPGLDWAMSALILAEVAVAPVAVAEGARIGLTSLLRHADPGVRLGDAGSGHLARARTRRAADPHLTESEVRLLGDAVALVHEVEAGIRR